MERVVAADRRARNAQKHSFSGRAPPLSAAKVNEAICERRSVS
jgi:hypothetical protein